MAGEFATEYKDKTVTLITSTDRLLPRQTQSLSDAAKKVLINKGVQLIFNDRADLKNVENFKPNKLTTQNGKQIEFDAFFVCIGGRPCTSVIKQSFPEWVDEDGFVKVDEYLNVITGDYLYFY